MRIKKALILDHITVVARTLDEGATYINDKLGVDMPIGGAHPYMGTHNRLLFLGANTFLELIAIDPLAVGPDRPRWFDLDNFDAAPSLGTWVLGTDNLEAALEEAHVDSGFATKITRGDLSWHISVPENGSMPLDGAFPTLIEWPESEHPAARMVDLGCRLRSLSVQHPAAEQVETLIGARIDRNLISICNGATKVITAEIETPSGIRFLS